VPIPQRKGRNLLVKIAAASLNPIGGCVGWSTTPPSFPWAIRCSWPRARQQQLPARALCRPASVQGSTNPAASWRSASHPPTHVQTWRSAPCTCPLAWSPCTSPRWAQQLAVRCSAQRAACCNGRPVAVPLSQQGSSEPHVCTAASWITAAAGVHGPSQIDGHGTPLCSLLDDSRRRSCALTALGAWWPRPPTARWLS